MTDAEAGQFATNLLAEAKVMKADDLVTLSNQLTQSSAGAGCRPAGEAKPGISAANNLQPTGNERKNNLEYLFSTFDLPRELAAVNMIVHPTVRLSCAEYVQTQKKEKNALRNRILSASESELDAISRALNQADAVPDNSCGRNIRHPG